MNKSSLLLLFISLPLILLSSCATDSKLPSEPDDFKVLEFPASFDSNKKINYSIRISFPDQRGRLKDNAKDERKKILQEHSLMGFLVPLNLFHLRVKPFVKGVTYLNGYGGSPCYHKDSISFGPALKICEYKDSKKVFSHKESINILQNSIINNRKGFTYPVKSEDSTWGVNPLLDFKDDTFTKNSTYINHGSRRWDRLPGGGSLYFKKGAGLGNINKALWVAPDSEYNVKKGRDAGVMGYRYEILAWFDSSKENLQNVIIPNVELLDFAFNNIPMISPEEYTDLLDKASEQMKKYGIDDKITSADSNRFNYHAQESVFFSDDWSGQTKFENPSHQLIRNYDSLMTMWGLIFLGYTTTSAERNGDEVIINFEIDVPAALSFAEPTDRENFIEK